MTAEISCDQLNVGDVVLLGKRVLAVTTYTRKHTRCVTPQFTIIAVSHPDTYGEWFTGRSWNHENERLYLVQRATQVTRRLAMSAHGNDDGYLTYPQIDEHYIAHRGAVPDKFLRQLQTREVAPLIAMATLKYGLVTTKPYKEDVV